MSIRFILLYLSSLVLTTLFFLNVSSTGKELSSSEYLLSKCLNQSQIFLLFGYIIAKYWKNYNTIVYLLIAYYFLFWVAEWANYVFSTAQAADEVNNICLILDRILMTIIFIKQGSSFFTKNFLKLIIFVVIIAVFGWLNFQAYQLTTQRAFYYTVISSISTIVFLFSVVNYPASKVFYMILLMGAILTTLSDTIYLYHRYVGILGFTFSWSRMIGAIGELLLLIVILKGKGIPKPRFANDWKI